MRERVTKAVGSNSFVIRMMNGWNKLPKEVVDMKSAHEFKEALEKAWLSVFVE